MEYRRLSLQSHTFGKATSIGLVKNYSTQGPRRNEMPLGEQRDVFKMISSPGPSNLESA